MSDADEAPETPTFTSLADVPADAPLRVDLRAILFQWHRIAAVACEGAIMQGRGFVLLAITEADQTISCVRDVPCPCHEELVHTYDFKTQVVVAVQRDDHAEVYCLEGFPTPVEAYETATAEVMGMGAGAVH